MVESDDDYVPPAVSKAQPPKVKPSKKKAISSDTESDDDEKACAAAKRQKKQGDALAAKKDLLKKMMDFAALKTDSQEVLDKAKQINPNMLIKKQSCLRTSCANAFFANKAAAPLINHWLDNPFKVADSDQLDAFRAYLRTNGFPATTKFTGIGYDWATHRQA